MLAKATFGRHAFSMSRYGRYVNTRTQRQRDSPHDSLYQPRGLPLRKEGSGGQEPRRVLVAGVESATFEGGVRRGAACGGHGKAGGLHREG